MSLGSNGHLRVAVERMRAAARSSLGGRPARPQRQPEHPSRAASQGPFDTPRRDSCWGHVDVRACAATPCTPVALLPARVTLPTRHFRTGHAPDAHGPWHIRPGTQSRRSATGWDPGSASSDTMGPGERIERQDGTHRRIECQVGTRIRPILRTSLSLNTAGGPSLSLNTADGPSLTLSATSGPNLTSGAWTRCGPEKGMPLRGVGSLGVCTQVTLSSKPPKTDLALSQSRECTPHPITHASSPRTEAAGARCTFTCSRRRPPG